MDYELEKSHGWKWFLWKISACGESFRSCSQKHLKTHLFVKYRCHSVRISHLKSWKWDAVAWIHISQAQEILTNIPSEEDGRFWALSSVKTWPLKASQMHCSVPVTAIMLGRTVQSSELWVMCQWWGIFNHTLPWSSSSEPGHLQVHQDPSRLIPELLLQHEFDSPEEGLHQLRKESLERDKGTMYLLIQWSFNTSLQPFNTSYAYALGR